MSNTEDVDGGSGFPQQSIMCTREIGLCRVGGLQTHGGAQPGTGSLKYCLFAEKARPSD